MKKSGDTTIHRLLQGQRSIGERAADTIATVAGSWTFILLFLAFLGFWMYLNVQAYQNAWDPYPFILLNLVLSCIAAIQAPIILMSQNRQTQKDRTKMEYDYMVNRKALKSIDEILMRIKELEEVAIKKHKTAHVSNRLLQRKMAEARANAKSVRKPLVTRSTQNLNTKKFPKK